MKRSNKSYYIGGLFLLLLMAGTFYYMLRDSGLSALSAVAGELNPLFLLCGLACVFVFISCEGLNIRLLMGSMGQRLSVADSVKFAFVGFYFSAITPSASGGQPMQIYFMQREKCPVSLSTLSFLVIGGVYQIVMLCFGGLMFLAESSFLSANVRGIHILLFYGMAVNLVLISLIFLVILCPNVIRRLAGFLVRLLGRLKLIKKQDRALKAVERYIEEYKQGARHIKRNPKTLLMVFLVTAVQLTAFYSVPFFVYQAMGLSGHSYLEIIATECILMISVSSLPLPGAVGASEMSFLTIFRGIFGENVVSAALLSRGISFYSYLVISGLVTAVTYIRVSRRRQRDSKYKAGGREIFHPRNNSHEIDKRIET